MSKFYDIKIHEYIKDLRFKSGDFSVWSNIKYSFNIDNSDLNSRISILKKFITSEDVNNITDLGNLNSIFDKSVFKNANLFQDITSGKINTNNLDLSLNMDLNLLNVLTSMEYSGIYLSIEDLKSISSELKDSLKNLEDKIFEKVGYNFNINSSKQLQKVLFEDLKIPPLKKTKTGYSTDSEVLNVIAKDHNIVNSILEYRSHSKLLSTYSFGLQKYISNTTNSVHTTYEITETSTGRLSSRDPNMQNIPVGDYYANKIRGAFKARDGYKLISYDYSQVEVRMLAYLSGDESLISAFANNEDIHEKTARYIFEKKDKSIEITSEERKYAKSVNFGVIYGITPFGLSKMLDLSPKDCGKYIEAFYEAYPGVKSYYDNLIKDAQKTSYVSTLFGRRRFLQTINDSNKTIRQRTEREAINMPVQGTASDIVKVAMINIHDFLLENNYKSKILLQIHDELVFEILEEELEELRPIIKKMMEEVLGKNNILKVDMAEGYDLSEAK